MSDPIQRPNGKTYRPRKAPSLEVFIDPYDEWEGVVVMRTHDIPRAVELAADRIAELELNPDLAYTVWWRLVPFGSSYDTTWIPDPVRGVPCVVIPYE